MATLPWSMVTWGPIGKRRGSGVMGTNQHHNKHRRDGAVPMTRILLFIEPHEISGAGTAGFQTWTREPQRSNVTCSRSLSCLVNLDQGPEASSLYPTSRHSTGYRDRKGPSHCDREVQSWSPQGCVSGLLLAPPTDAWPRDMSVHMLGVPFSRGSPKPQWPHCRFIDNASASDRLLFLAP